jgi:hypothetical protein
MRIVFGINSFKAHTFTPEELGIPNESKVDLKFEVRQKYFHLFWIPTFGIGKDYILHKDGGAYELPSHYVEHIKNTGKVKTPWYTFALPLLVLLGVLGYWANEEYQKFSYNSYADTELAAKVQILEKEITKLDTTQYLLLEIVNNDRYSSKKYVMAKINGSKGDQLKVSVVNLDNQLSSDLLPIAVYKAYDKSVDRKDFLISKKDLIAAIGRDRDSLQNSLYSGVALLGSSDKYLLEEIEYFNQPVIRMTGSGGYNSQSISMNVACVGTSATLVEIKNIAGEMKWVTELPLKLQTDSTLLFGTSNYIKAENYKDGDPYKFMLVVTDTLGKRYKFSVEGESLTNTTTRIE